MSQMHLMSQFRQCDVCARFTTRVHHTIAYGTDTTACDKCSGYEPEAYGEEPAQYLTEAEYKLDREAETKSILEAALQEAKAEQVAEAIINIFSDADIGLITGRLITPRKHT